LVFHSPFFGLSFFGLNCFFLFSILGVWLFGVISRRVAGWRQKEKPLLYNVFHIGDQIIRVSHCNVSSSVDVNRLIKNESSGQVIKGQSPLDFRFISQ
jgi:hypothetical protein